MDAGPGKDLSRFSLGHYTVTQVGAQQPVPAPQTIGLIALGLLALGGLSRMRFEPGLDIRR